MAPRLKALVWIVRPAVAGNEVLLLRRPDRRGRGEHPVTGKADGDETPLSCARREALEETGLRGDLRDLQMSHRYEDKKRGPFVEHAFVMLVKKGAEPVISDEHIGYRWADFAEARAALEWPAHRDALDAARAALRAGLEE